MTTYSTNSRWKHTTDAEYQEWVQEWHDILIGVGLTQTSDTGQYATSPVTLTRPAVNTLSTGYLIYRFNDTLQATAPIFMKFRFGTGASLTNRPQIYYEVGTGTDGSGNITGLIRAGVMINGYSADVETAYPSDACYSAAAGFFGLSWKGQSNGFTFFMVARSCDSNGSPTGVGALFFHGETSTSFIVQHYDYVDVVTQNGSYITAPFCCAYGNYGNIADDNGDTPVYLCYVAVPQPQPLIGLCGLANGGLAHGGTFSTTLFGATPHTYMYINNANVGASGSYFACMLWE